LAAFVICVGVVGIVYYFGQEGRERPKQQRGNATGLEEGMKLAGQQFDYTFSNKERPIFHITGDTVSMDEDETVYLQKVGLTLWDQRGNRWDCQSVAGSLNQATKEGRLWGDVVVNGPDDLELHTAQLQIKEKGNLVMTPRPAQIFYASKYYIRTNSLQVWLPDEVYSLVGDLEIESLPDVIPPVTLSATRGIYERKRRQIRVEEDAELHRGKDVINADKMSAILSADENSITFVRALYHVVGETHTPPKPNQPETVVHFKGNDLAVLLQPEGNLVRQVDLLGDETARAVIESHSGEFVRTMTAPHITGNLAANVLTAAQAFEEVDIHEVGPPVQPSRKGAARPGTPARKTDPASSKSTIAALPGSQVGPPVPQAPAKPEEPPKPLDRQAHAKRADATFRTDGQLSTVHLFDNVTYTDGEIKANGDRAQMDFEAGSNEFFGNPVDASSPRGKMRSPHVTYTTADELMHADQGVRAVLEQQADQAAASGPLGSGKGPITVEAKDGYWRRNPSSFQFRGDVRAWREDNLLLAPEVNGDRLESGDQLSASGGVKTVWVPDQQSTTIGPRKPATPAPKKTVRSPGSATQPPALGTKELAHRGPFTVVANSLLYRDGARLLTYTDNVHVDQDGKTIDCQQLDVELDQDKKAKNMICTGNAHLNDPATGRVVDGDKAVYRVAQRKIDVTGDIVTMRDRDGNVVHGQRIIYAIDTGKAEVVGKVPAPPSGPSGASGPGSPATGTSGPSGVMAPSGPSGIGTTPSAAGSSGASGPTGPSGATGPTGTPPPAVEPPLVPGNSRGYQP
jgi:lipopolysaccharide transport protein LptA